MNTVHRHSVGALCSCFFFALKLIPDLYRAKAISTVESSCLLNVAEVVRQCPISGSLHFYGVLSYNMLSQSCVNALSRAHFISTESGKHGAVAYLDKMCQCPISGSRHFYFITQKSVKDQLGCVNALSRAHVISTLTREATGIIINNRVNALSRAHVISTWVELDRAEAKKMCQCPISGSRHFYKLW